MRELLTSQEAAESQGLNADTGVSIPRQRVVLLEALRERDGRLATIYDAVIRIMTPDDLPDQLSLAAHGMRELMERLPIAFDVPIQEKHHVLDRVSDVERDLSRAQQSPRVERAMDGRGR
jgi:hypothetical protein